MYTYLYMRVFFYLYLSLELLESLLEQVLAFPALLVEVNLFG